MRISFIISTMLVVFIVAMAGCTSPSPTSPSPVTVSPTAAPTAVENASPTPAPNATASATASPTATAAPSPIVVGDKIAVSDISIDWDTTDIMQHDTIHLKVKNIYQYMLLDTDVIYTVSTPGVIINPDNTSYVQNQTSPPVTIQLGQLNAGATKDVTIQSDHKKNVPAYITIKVNWREGSQVVFQGVLNVTDHSFGTKTF